MAPSPKDRYIDLVSYTVSVDGTELPGAVSVLEIVVSRELGKIPFAKLTVVDGSPTEENYEESESNRFKVGGVLKIQAGYHQENEDIFEGVITSSKSGVGGEGQSKLVVMAKDKAVKMTTARKNKYFVQKKDSDIMSEIIGEAGLSADVEATKAVHKEVIQYYSSNWDFLITRAEFNGLVVNVNAGKVEVKKPDVSSGPVLTVKHGTDLLKTNLDMSAERQIKTVKAKAWDPNTQALVEVTAAEPEVPSHGDEDGTSMADSVGGEEVELHSTVPLDSEYLQTWADARLLKSRLSKITGSVTFNGSTLVKPNTVIEIQGMGSKYNGNAFVSGVHHRISEGTWVTECSIGLSEKWFSETKPNIGGGAGGGLLPGIEGLQIGKVQKIDSDPDGQFRVLVDIPMIAASGDGVWARLASPFASNNFGWTFFPHVGDEVILGFLNHDPRYPIILGSVYSQTNVNQFPADEPNTYKALVTATQMKIEFEDVKRIITVVTPNGNTIIINDDEQFIRIEDEWKNFILMDTAGVEVNAYKDMKLIAAQNINMEAGQAITVKAGTDMKMDAINITAKGSATFTGEGSGTATLKGGGQAVVKGGVVMIN